MTTMITASNLQRTYGAHQAVKGLDFSVEKGEIFGLLGPNGAGKTTTIRMLTGQIDPTGGSAQVAGYDILKERAQLKRAVGVVFEHQNLYERLSARQNIEFVTDLYGVPKKRIDEVLELVNLRDRANDKIKAFSNGMKQRVMIARALVHHPEVLFLDEPSRGLDPVSARDIRNAIQQLAESGMTIVLTTHLMEEADQLSRHVGFLVHGELVALDTPQRLKIQHGTRALKVTLNTSEETHLLQMDDPRAQAQLAQWLNAGLVQAMHSAEATLEDVFLKIAGVHLA